MIAGIGLIDRIATDPVGGGLSGVTPPRAPTTAATSFAAALQEAAGNAVTTLERAETMSVQALQGEVETREVVDAVMSAEQTLQTAIAIRDKIVTAFLEVSRMAM